MGSVSFCKWSGRQADPTHKNSDRRPSGDAILDHERGEHVAEDGSDVCHRPIGTVGGLVGVGEDLVAIDAEEFAGAPMLEIRQARQFP